MKSISTLLCFILLVSPAYGQKAKLSLKLEEGETYKQISHSKMNIDQDVYGMKMNIVIDMNASMSFLVKAVSKEGYDLELSYDWMNMTMEMPQASMEFSSEKNDESDLFSSILAEMKNKPLNLKMDKKGRITDIEDVEAKWEAVFNLFEQFPKEQRDQVKSQLLSSYGGKAITGSIETYTAIFPEKPVKKGAQWNVVTNLESGMPSTLTSTLTYEGMEDELAVLNSEGSIKTIDSEEYVETNGMMMKYQLEGTMNATIKLDPESGWIRSVSEEKTIRGNAKIKANDQMPDGMDIPMKISSVTEISSE